MRRIGVECRHADQRGPIDMGVIALSTPSLRPPAPVPRKVPFGLFGRIAAMRRNPIEIWADIHYEKPVLVGRSLIGDRAVVSDPAAVRRVLLDNVANYRKDDLQLRLLRPGLGNGLLTADGDEWRVQRRLLAPLFALRQIAGFAPAMAAVATEGAARLAAKGEGAQIDLLHEMARVTLEVLERTLFSQGLGREASEFQVAVAGYFDTIGRIDPLDVLGVPQFVPRLGRRRGRSSLDFFRNAVDEIIGARRRLLASGEPAPHDILTLLLSAEDPETGHGMSLDDIRSNIVTFIGAGHETTANAMTWCLYLLQLSPEWRARVEAEVDREFVAGPIETLAERLPETKAVFEETLRLYPPAASLSRAAIADDVLGGKPIRAGTIVTVSPYVLHRHRTLWKDPDVFDPNRFLGARRNEIDRFAYMPFGAGPRVCIGMGFAIEEGLILLAHIVHRLRFELAKGHKVELQQRITLRPKGGMPMVIHLRDGAC
jgi:cytochrome P450